MSGSKAKARFSIGLVLAIFSSILSSSSASAYDEVYHNWTAPASSATADGLIIDKFAPVPSQYTGCFLASWGAFNMNHSLEIQGSNIVVSGASPAESMRLELKYMCNGNTQFPVVFVTGTSLNYANSPLFGTVVSYEDGFTVEIVDYDANFEYSVSSSQGTAGFQSPEVVAVRGLAPGATAVLTVTTSQTGYANGSSTVSASALPANLPTPVLNTPVSAADGFSFRILNKTAQLDVVLYTIDDAPWPAGVSTIRGSDNTVSIIGLQAGQVLSLAVHFRGTDERRNLSAPVTVTGSALEALAVPMYPSAFAQSATSAFVTWGSVDGATGYTVTASNGGGTCTNTINYCTVTGLTAGQNYTFSIVATRAGQSSPAAVTAPVLMASALDVGGSLTSSTWKVGAVVVANPLIIGQYSIVRHQWYRCATAVAVQEAAPSCEVITGATGGTYTLTAADLGKYVTSHMTVTGGAGVVTATLANTRAVLAANAAGGALVDPDGKPLIAEIPTRQISVVGGTTITITGTGFTGVTSVLVNGTAATVLSATDTTLVISVPASTQVGLVDLAVTTPKGTVTEASALAYVAKQASISSKKKTLTRFSGSATKLSTKQKAEIKAFVKANSTMPKLTCAATTVGVKKSSTEAKAALARAKAACSYAASVSKNVFTSSNGAQGKTTGKVSKLVTLTISN